MNTIIETDRLLHREFAEHDAALIYELKSEPDVTKYTHDIIRNIVQAKETFERLILPRNMHCIIIDAGAVHVKHTLEFIGGCSLKYRNELNETDLGYRFKKQAWGKGFAT